MSFLISIFTNVSKTNTYVLIQLEIRDYFRKSNYNYESPIKST